MFTIITCALYLLCANTKAFIQCNQFLLVYRWSTLILRVFILTFKENVCRNTEEKLIFLKYV